MHQGHSCMYSLPDRSNPGRAGLLYPFSKCPDSGLGKSSTELKRRDLNLNFGGFCLLCVGGEVMKVSGGGSALGFPGRAVGDGLQDGSLVWP